MDGDTKQSTVSLTIGSVTRTYKLWETNAPAAYDKDYTLHVMGDVAPESPGVYGTRLVLIPEIGSQTLLKMSSGHPQILRYRSGLFTVTPSDLLPAEGQSGLEAILWKAIHTLHRGQD